ncbi:MAG TPA: lytic transglycosylase domain-containing protein [Pyrinomonadaceae bacterium]|nr:lytic transglycosylase domain-containing protein [Pyrinomonadaceae bacterium]
MVFDHIVRRFSKAVLLLGFVMFGFVAVASAQAQQSAVPPQASVAPQASTPADPKSELKSSLTELSTLYQNEVQRLEKQQQQSQQLYNDGLISRVEFEKGEKALAEARAKVESVAREITVANQPVPMMVTGADSTTMGAFSNLAWSTGNSRVDGLIKLYGGQYGVDPYLIYCLMSQESSFMSSAVSPKGAQGLMQLMPDTAARYGVTNPYDVAQNIKGGTRYLKDLLKMFNGRVDLALAGYNAGEGAVMKYGNAIPPYDETRTYVKLILKRYTKKPVS